LLDFFVHFSRAQVKAIFGAVVQMNQNGIHFPLWVRLLGGVGRRAPLCL
jgi:hypothetical protein